MTAPWPEVSAEEWGDWRWQLRHQLRSASDLEQVIRLTDDERAAIPATADRFRLGVTPYYASLMNPDDPRCPIRLQAVPSTHELTVLLGERPDPLAEERDMPVPGLTHRYPDRVLLYTSHTCAVYCRHCTRRRKVSDPGSAPPWRQLQAGLDYIAAHPEVRDVVLSGGDPLSLGEGSLDRLLGLLRQIPHVEIIRLGSRHPTTLPQRITPELCEVLRRHLPLYVMTHFNHPAECTPEATAACARLSEAGCVLANQMVLLVGVNDDARIVRDLNHRLLQMRVRPYRMFQCDWTEGLGHFRAPLQLGIEIIDALRGWTSGLAVPDFVVDLPGGHGKATPYPGAVLHQGADRWVLRSFRGEPVTVDASADPADVSPAAEPRAARADRRR